MPEPNIKTNEWDERQTFLVELSRQIISSIELDELIGIILPRIQAIMNAEACDVSVYNPHARTLQLQYGVGWEKALIGSNYIDDRMDYCPGCALFGETPVVTDETISEVSFPLHPWLVDQGIRSSLSARIKDKGQPFGILSVHSQTARRFNRDDTSFLQAAANLIAAFIQRGTIEKAYNDLNLSLERQMEFDQNKHPIRMVGTVQDTSDSVELINQLQEHDQLLDNVLTQGNVVIWVMDLEGNQQLIRRGGLATLGIPLGDRMDVNIFNTIAETHPLAKFLRQALHGEVIDVDFMVGDRTYDLRILPRRNQQGEINGVSGIAFDITQRKEIEQTLYEREQSYRQLVDNIKDYAIYSLDTEGHVTQWNEGARRLKGYQAEEIIGRHFSIFYTSEACQHGLVDRALQIAREKGRYESEGLRVRKDGSQFWANVIVAPILDTENELVGYTKVVRDFSERREFELALQDSESKFRSIFEYAAIGSALLDLEGNFLLANAPLRKLLGVEAQAVPALNLKSIIFEIDFETLIERFSDTAAGNLSLFRRESRIRRPDGQVVWASLTFSLVRDSDNNSLSMIGMFEDINDRKRMEAELREIKRQIIRSQETQRMHLAQELHDDPMQELYGVLYQLDLGDESLPKNELIPQLHLAKESVQQVIHKLRVICGQLRPQSLAPFGLEGAIREYMGKFQDEHPELNVHLSLNYDGQLISEEVRISLFRILQQALGNIIRHAQAENVTIRFNYDDRIVFLEVEDDGIGFEVPPGWINFARQDHLGLAGASERVELLDGKFTVRSNPGQGTLIRAEIPLQTEDDPALGERLKDII